MTTFQKIVIAILAVIACVVIAAIGTVGYLFLNPVASAVPPPPTVAPASPPATPIVLSFDGEGDKVIFFDAPASGAALFGFGHRGERNFIVNLLQADGTFVDLLVNDVGNYDGEKTLQLDQGSYMLEITASGPWVAVILPPQ